MDISITPSPKTLEVKLQSLKITHKILDAKVVGHEVLTELLRSSNLVKGVIDKIINNKVPGIINTAIKKAIDPKNSNGFEIKQLTSHVARIGTNGLTYPESHKEISVSVLLSFTKKQDKFELKSNFASNDDINTEFKDESQSLKFLEDLSETPEINLLNFVANSIFTPSKHIRIEISQEVVNTITDVIFEEGLINFEVNNDLLSKISKGKDDLFNLNTKFFEKTLPCLADYPNQNFTVAISALSKPVSKITNDGKQQIITFNLNLNIKYLLDKNPKIALLNINANIDAGVILLPIENPEATIFINISSIKLSKVDLIQKCGKLTGDDIVTALGPPLRLTTKILNLKVLQNGIAIKSDSTKPLSITNIELTTTNEKLNVDILAHILQ